MEKKKSDKLTSSARRHLPDSAYGLPDKREFPMPDAQHVHAAEAYFRYALPEDKPRLARNILEKAKQYGVDVESDTIHDWADRDQ